MKLVCLFLGCLLASCDLQTDCDGAFVSASVPDSRRSGLLVYELRPAPNAAGRVPVLPDTVRVERYWVERTAKVDCLRHGVAVLPGNTVVVQLTRPLPNHLAITLNGQHPLAFNGLRLAFNLGERQPAELTFQLHASPAGSHLNNVNGQVVGAWKVVK